MARSRRESLLSDGITDQKCPQGLLQQNLPLAEVFDFVRAALSALIGTGVDGSPVAHA